MEVINDKDGELVNLFRCIKYHAPALEEEMRWVIPSRQIFLDSVAQLKSEGLTDIQRAARFLCTLKLSFGSNRRSFATSAKSFQRTLNYLSKVQERLENVTIENRDFEYILKTYDRPDALFYLDPPYLGTEKYYEGMFGWDDHLRLADNLKKIKGRFVLSYNDDDRIRELYNAWCNIESVQRRETLSGSGENQKSFKEVIIKNF